MPLSTFLNDGTAVPAPRPAVAVAVRHGAGRREDVDERLGGGGTDESWAFGSSVPCRWTR
jgi:hypothetical protein